MNLKTAIDIVARVMTSNAAEDWFDGGWEQIPDIGEWDFERVETRMRQLLPSRNYAGGNFDEAMAFLEARTDKETT